MTNYFCAGHKVFKNEFKRITYSSSCDKTSLAGFSFTGGGLYKGARKDKYLHMDTYLQQSRGLTSSTRVCRVLVRPRGWCSFIFFCFLLLYSFSKSHFPQVLTDSVPVAERSRFLRLLRNSAISAARLSAFSFSMSPSNF